jgi:hypothetical protein
MDYESFRTAWTRALRDSRLPIIGLYPEESLDTRNLDRKHKVYVEPLGRQDAPPFHVTATLSWTWNNLNTVRGTLRDEDIFVEMLGRDRAAGLMTEKPYVRVDIVLSARAPYDKPLPMPSTAAWAKWIHETIERLDHVEPLLPDETLRENRMGMTEALGWQESPKVTAVCAPSGDLLLEAIEISAGQLIEVPRLLDCPDEPDEDPEEELTDLFGRVKASLCAWMQALDHLRAETG